MADKDLLIMNTDDEDDSDSDTIIDETNNEEEEQVCHGIAFSEQRCTVAVLDLSQRFHKIPMFFFQVFLF